MSPEDYVGIPYSKLDCFALVRLVALECYGLVYPKLIEYSDTPQAVLISALTDKRWVEIPMTKAIPSDVITLSHTDKPASHVGIIIGAGWVLHNDKKYGCIIQTIEQLRRRGLRYTKIYRWCV